MLNDTEASGFSPAQFEVSPHILSSAEASIDQNPFVDMDAGWFEYF